MTSFIYVLAGVVVGLVVGLDGVEGLAVVGLGVHGGDWSERPAAGLISFVLSQGLVNRLSIVIEKRNNEKWE